jgi:tetratricopeptide (TPR) repeat protein
VRSSVLSSGVVVIVAGLGLALAAGSLAAAPPRVSAQLEREFQAGVDAYRLGKYDKARAHLEKAESLDPKLPGPHRFLAAVARAQRRYADCITESRRALQLNPQSSEVAGTRKLHDECRAADGRPAFGAELGDNAAIAITANVAGATVRIGALRYGGTPVAPRLIKPGFHELEIEKTGWKPAHLAIDALPGIVTDVDVTLEPIAPKSQ